MSHSCCHRGQAQYEQLAEDLPTLCRLTPHTRLTNRERLRKAEHFFYAAHAAAGQSVLTEVIDPLANYSGVSRDDAINQLFLTDEDVSMALVFFATSDTLHNLYAGSPDGFQGDVAATLSTQVHTCGIALGIGLLMQNELGLEIDDVGSRSYSDTSQLNAVRRTSRENALAKIADCCLAGIPCPAAIASFQTAEASCDDPDEDQVNVLVGYWSASLQAQVFADAVPIRGTTLRQRANFVPMRITPREEELS